MNKLTLMAVMAFASFAVLAQLPSWGMTEQQYKMPNRNAKLADIGKQAVKNKWQLKVTAPKDWHGAIRSGLSQDGALNVMMTVQDSLHSSISITASKAKQLGVTVSPSGDQTVVKKQAVIDDEVEIDTSVERPEFGEDFNGGKPALADVGMDMTLPKMEHKVVAKQPAAEPTTPNPQPKPAVKPEPQPKPQVNADNNEDKLEAARSYLRKRHAKSKQVSDRLNYDQIDESDDLYIKDGVVLVVRERNKRPFYYWMNEQFDAATQAIQHLSQNRYKKTEAASATGQVQQVKNDTTPQVAKQRTALDFVAVTDQQGDQDALRREHIRNKAVNHNIKASQLKAKDRLFVRNETVLVVRELSRINVIYFWLEGDASTVANAVAKRANEFVIE